MSVIYFVKAGDAIKIGYSRDLARRLTLLATLQPEPLTVLCVKIGGRAEEALLHTALKAHRLQGEWFRDCSEVRAAMEGGLHDFPVVAAEKPKKAPYSAHVPLCATAETVVRTDRSAHSHG